MPAKTPILINGDSMTDARGYGAVVDTDRRTFRTAPVVKRFVYDASGEVERADVLRSAAEVGSTLEAWAGEHIEIFIRPGQTLSLFQPGPLDYVTFSSVAMLGTVAFNAPFASTTKPRVLRFDSCTVNMSGLSGPIYAFEDAGEDLLVLEVRDASFTAPLPASGVFEANKPSGGFAFLVEANGSSDPLLFPASGTLVNKVASSNFFTASVNSTKTLALGADTLLAGGSNNTLFLSAPRITNTSLSAPLSLSDLNGTWNTASIMHSLEERFTVPASTTQAQDDAHFNSTVYLNAGAVFELGNAETVPNDHETIRIVSLAETDVDNGTAFQQVSAPSTPLYYWGEPLTELPLMRAGETVVIGIESSQWRVLEHSKHGPLDLQYGSSVTASTAVVSVGGAFTAWGAALLVAEHNVVYAGVASGSATGVVELVEWPGGNVRATWNIPDAAPAPIALSSDVQLSRGGWHRLQLRRVSGSGTLSLQGVRIRQIPQITP